ncbi:lysine--tRNA ligase [Candidatus Uhrbacteria bacterium]|nr:lysine--tRNA ligase [Candidatus Uhrbacteria bacterium]
MDRPEEYNIRIKKAEALEKTGVSLYPSGCGRTHMCAAARTIIEQEGRSVPVTVAGRIRQIRKHGGSTFARLEDESGDIQLYLKKDAIGDERYARFLDDVDLGDILEAAGELFVTKTGESSVLVYSYAILAKALLPLPDQWHGLCDVEQRYRHRELDLIANEDVRRRFVVRSKLVSALRRFLDDRDFLEVETPILQSIPGGASARPFMTHHNALDVDMYLRIAPELYLKRLIIGGFERLYEIGRTFRNEGIDFAHSPEFSMIELYWAYVPDRDLYIRFLEELLRYGIREAIGTLVVVGEEHTIDFGSQWPQITFRDAVHQETGIDIDVLKNAQDVLDIVKKVKLSIDFSNCVGLGEHIDQLFKKTARQRIVQPTWILDYPIELKPLTRACDDDPTKSASAQLIVEGVEIVNAYYHELNDPREQRTRFMQQEVLRAQGSESAQFVDEDFLFALEHGMPPTSGMGFGIDRLVLFLTGQKNIKEVILFPTLRPKE